MIWYKFGSSVEEIGKSGLAHFMEHLMFKGTKKFPKKLLFKFFIKKLVALRMHLQAMIIQLIIKYFLVIKLRK